MGSFKQEKGKIIMDMKMGADLRVVVHKRTDPVLVKMFSDALDRAKEETIQKSK
jgi:hypothetical protein